MRPSRSPVARRALQGAHGGRADGDDPLGGAARLPASPPARGSAHCAWGGRAGRASVTGWNVSRPTASSTAWTATPRRVIALDQLGGQVQAGRRRGGRARPAGVDGLVALGPIEAGRDVRRQRHLADPLERRRQRCSCTRNVSPASVRPSTVATLAPSPSNRSSPARRRRAGRTIASHVIASSDSSSRTSTAPPVARRSRSRAGRTRGIVDDDHVTRAHEIREVGHGAMVRRRAPPVDEQASGISRLDRHLRNAVRRQLVVELLQPHRRHATNGHADVSPPEDVRRGRPSSSTMPRAPPTRRRTSPPRGCRRHGRRLRR